MEAAHGTPLLDCFRRGDVPRDVRLLAAQGGLAPRATEQIALLVHLLGDAYAPRRLVFATRQAYALAEELSTVDEAALPTLQLIPAGAR